MAINYDLARTLTWQTATRARSKGSAARTATPQSATTPRRGLGGRLARYETLAASAAAAVSVAMAATPSYALTPHASPAAPVDT
jgi:hypothetical protein